MHVLRLGYIFLRPLPPCRARRAYRIRNMSELFFGQLFKLWHEAFLDLLTLRTISAAIFRVNIWAIFKAFITQQTLESIFCCKIYLPAAYKKWLL